MARAFRILAAVIALIGFAWSHAHAQIPLTGAGRGAPVAAGGCSQATAFLARTSGLDGTHTTAYTNLICGLVTDSVWTKLDALYIPATQDSTTAKLNLVSASFPITVSGSPTWTANVGYDALGLTNFLDTSFNASTAGGSYTQNSNHISACFLTLNSVGGVPIGNTDGSSFAEILFNTTSTDLYMQQAGSAPASNAAVPVAALWLGTRTASNAIRLDKNGTQVATNTTVSTALINNSIHVLGRNNSGVNDQETSGTVAAASIGGALTTTDSGNFHTRLNAYITAVGGSGC